MADEIEALGDTWLKASDQSIALGSENTNAKAFALSIGQGHEKQEAGAVQLRQILEQNAAP